MSAHLDIAMIEGKLGPTKKRMETSSPVRLNLKHDKKPSILRLIQAEADEEESEPQELELERRIRDTEARENLEPRTPFTRLASEQRTNSKNSNLKKSNNVFQVRKVVSHTFNIPPDSPWYTKAWNYMKRSSLFIFPYDSKFRLF